MEPNDWSRKEGRQECVCDSVSDRSIYTELAIARNSITSQPSFSYINLVSERNTVKQPHVQVVRVRSSVELVSHHTHGLLAM